MASCPTAQTSGHACAAVAATLEPRHTAEACQRIRHRDRGRSDSHGSDTADGARRCACVGGRGPQASRRVISALRVSTEAQPARSRPPTRKKSREFVPRTLSTRSNFTSCHDSYVATCCQRVRTSPAVTADRRSPCMARACRSAHKHGPRAATAAFGRRTAGADRGSERWNSRWCASAVRFVAALNKARHAHCPFAVAERACICAVERRWVPQHGFVSMFPIETSRTCRPQGPRAPTEWHQ